MCFTNAHTHNVPLVQVLFTQKFTNAHTTDDDDDDDDGDDDDDEHSHKIATLRSP